jgi:N,N-dimethylformamidase
MTRPAKDLVGYADRLTARPGDIVAIKVSAEPGEAYAADLVDLSDPMQQNVPAAFAGTYAATPQALQPGSFAQASCELTLTDVTLQLFAFPTAPSRRRDQVLMAICADDGTAICSLYLDGEGRLAFHVKGAQPLVLETPLMRRRWYKITASYAQGSKILQLTAEPKPLGCADAVLVGLLSANAQIEAIPVLRGRRVVLAAGSLAPADCYNGKLEAAAIFAATMTPEQATVANRSASHQCLAAWDFAASIGKQTIPDTSGYGRDALLHQVPTGGVTGYHWDGSCRDWTVRPDHYAALHFHEDDMADAGWKTSFEWQVPSDLQSGVYGVRLIRGDSVDIVPVFVRSEPASAASILYLAPTASYLAYANTTLFHQAGLFGPEAKDDNPNDAYLKANRGVGLSMYEHHADGSGVHISSRHRPILNMKPGGTDWAFGADLHILQWLRQTGERFDVATDEDLHVEQGDLLTPYRVIVTGSHPEYYSTPMRSAIEAFLAKGGRLIYMGANGFYWRVAFHKDLPGVMEVRRAEDGTRAWISAPGEFVHAFNGEYGGLWRRIGDDKTPNALVGVGFAAQGFYESAPFLRTDAASNPRAAFIFEGTSEGAEFGAYGLNGGGAAGEEIDRFDPRLGSPRHALVIARSRHQVGSMLRTKEEHLVTMPVMDDPDIRADMTFFETLSGGAVFSTSSIAYAGALQHRQFQNDCARIITNVLRRFANPKPFIYPRNETPHVK